MAEIVLRVTPEVLEQKAEEFSTILDGIRSSFDQILNISSRTKGYWQGEAGDQDRKGYASYEEEVQAVLKRLEEHPADLLSMAGIYRTAEKEAVSTNAALQTDQIV